MSDCSCYAQEAFGVSSRIRSEYKRAVEYTMRGHAGAYLLDMKKA